LETDIIITTVTAEAGLDQGE